MSEFFIFVGHYLKAYFLLSDLVVLGLCCSVGFSLDAADEDYSLVVACKLLTAVASRCSSRPLEHRLNSCGSRA